MKHRTTPKTAIPAATSLRYAGFRVVETRQFPKTIVTSTARTRSKGGYCG